MKAPKTLFSAAIALAMTAGAVVAKTEVHWWHAMGGTNGERVDKIAADFNASQSDYEIVPTYKGNYTETMTAAIAAFRAGEQPHLVQVFEVGTATMMAAKGAIYPAQTMVSHLMDQPTYQQLYLIIKHQKVSFYQCHLTALHQFYGITLMLLNPLVLQYQLLGMK